MKVKRGLRQQTIIKQQHKSEIVSEIKNRENELRFGLEFLGELIVQCVQKLQTLYRK